LSDLTTAALQYAVDALSLRQQAVAGNLANAQTPNYQAKEVDFEGSLSQALAAGNVGLAGAPTVTTSGAPSDANGNNVDPSNDIVTLQETTLRYQAMVDSLNAKFRMLRGSMGGGFT
jgi:flagellar basal-body rod protein FlgB